MICFTDRCAGLYCTSILNLNCIMKKLRKKNNINETDLGNYKHLKRYNIFNNIVTII